LKFTRGHTRVNGQYQCPGYLDQDRMCLARFNTPGGLRRHMKKQGHGEPYFRYARHLSKESLTCQTCGFVPWELADNPRKGLVDHRRKRHRLEYMRERRPYTIEEEP